MAGRAKSTSGVVAADKPSEPVPRTTSDKGMIATRTPEEVDEAKTQSLRAAVKNELDGRWRAANSARAERARTAFRECYAEAARKRKKAVGMFALHLSFEIAPFGAFVLRVYVLAKQVCAPSCTHTHLRAHTRTHTHTHTHADIPY